MKKLYFLPILLLIFSCKDNDENTPKLSFPRSYYNALSKTTTVVRLFTKNGEIKDENLIKKFVINYGNDNLHYDGKTETLVPTDTITFLSSTEVKTSRSKTVDFKSEINGTNVKLTPVDTVKFTTDQPVDENEIMKAVLKHKPIYILKSTTPKGSGFTYSYQVIQYYLLTIEENALKIPTINYIIKSQTSTGTSTRGVTTINSFEENSYKYLSEGDTMGVQEGLTENYLVR